MGHTLGLGMPVRISMPEQAFPVWKIELHSCMHQLHVKAPLLLQISLTLQNVLRWGMQLDEALKEASLRL